MYFQISCNVMNVISRGGGGTSVMEGDRDVPLDRL